jgi:hypothetical protein
VAAAASTLVWSVTAMTDTTQRLSRVAAADQPRGFTVIHEAVWRVTIVDATLVRHHPAAYDRVMAGQAPAQRELVEGILAGLRFVRNRIGGDGDLGEFIEPAASSRALLKSGSPAGPGGRCQNRRRRRCRQAGEHGTGQGTADTRSNWRTTPSARP